MLSKKTVVLTVSLMLVSNILFAELSSRAKKAEKLVGSGKITEAMEIYKDLMEKDPQRNAALIKEGREGMANCLLLQAQDAYKAKKYLDAKALTENILKDYEDTPSLKAAEKYLVLSHVGIAKVFVERENFDDCIAQSKEVKDKVSSDTEGLDKLNGVIGTAIYGQGKKALDAKDFKGAIAKFESVIKDYPQTDKLAAVKSDLADASLAVAAFLADHKNNDQALSIFRKIISDYSDKTDVVLKAKQGAAKILISQADENLAAKKYVEAIKNFEAALALSPDKEGSAKCRYGLGVCFRMTQQNEKAVSCYREVVSNYADSSLAATAYADLYLVYMELDNKQEALNSIKQADLLSPDNTDYLFKQTQLLYDLNKIEDAQKVATKLLGLLQVEVRKTYQYKENVQYKIGQAYLILGKYTEAAVEFDKALTRNPDMLEAKKSLALAQFSERNYSAAAETYESLIRWLSSDFDEANEKAEKDNSVELAREIEDLRKDIAFFHYQKGLSYEQLGEFDKAEAECRQGFEGVSTQEAAATLKRIQSAAQQKAKAKTAQ